MRIDDQATVPLTWLAVILCATSSAIVVGAFWVQSVNDRLGEIEEKLGIARHDTSFFTTKVHADEKR